MRLLTPVTLSELAFFQRFWKENMANILEILMLDVKTGVSKAGKPYTLTEAHCLLRNEDGSPAGVGRTLLDKSVAETAKPGLYLCSFGLRAATYGEDSGLIVSSITALTAIQPSQLKRSVAANSV